MFNKVSGHCLPGTVDMTCIMPYINNFAPVYHVYCCHHGAQLYNTIDIYIDGVYDSKDWLNALRAMLNNLLNC